MCQSAADRRRIESSQQRLVLSIYSSFCIPIAPIIFHDVCLLHLQVCKATCSTSQPQVTTRPMKALKCKPSVFAYSYSIKILSKYSSLISHRPSMFEGRHINHRSSKVDTSIIDRSSKVNTSISEGRHIVTSIFEGRHIDIRKSTHRSSKVDASIFEDRRRNHHTYNSSSNIVHNCAPKSLDPWSRRSYTRSFCSYIHKNK